MHTRAATTALAALLLATSAALAGCSDDSSDPASADDTTSSAPSPSPSMGTGEFPRYVALGDSYTAAPLVPTTDTSNGCLRSDHNYAHLVASSFEGTALVDVSCSGADTTALVGVQTTADGGQHEPQFDALTEDTALVTLGIGGNDLGLFASLVGSCSQAGAADPQGSPCTDAAGDQVEKTLATIQQRITSAALGVLDRSPDARVLVVGYPQIVPSKGSCPDLLPLAEGDLPFARAVDQGLAEATQRAAEDAGVEYVDVHALSRGHDICSADPWVNGKDTQPDAALAFHPYAAEQAAVADQIVKQLG